MDALRAAAPLARLLLALDEAKSEGELELGRAGQRVRLRVVDGRFSAILGVETDALGDLLSANGALDRRAEPALRPMRRARIGARLIAAGATSGAAVERALSTQLLRRFAAIARTPPCDVSWRPAAAGSLRRASFSVAIAGAVWSTLLTLASELPSSSLSTLSADGALALTAVGRVRLSAFSRALACGDLARGLCALPQPMQPPLPSELVPELLLAARPPAHLQPLRACLRALGMAVDEAAAPAPRVDGYALLLRKRRELARNLSASALLDLPEAAGPAHARKALRLLAKKLHPDRFQASDARLRSLFDETLGALSRAEHALRTAT